MSRLPLIAFAVLSGCRPSTPKTEPQYAVAPSSLVRVFRDTPNLAAETWNDRHVTIRLDAKTYTVDARAVNWFSTSEKVSPTIIFECTNPPADNTYPIQVVGKCRGMIRDGIRRDADIRFYVRIVDCSVTVIRP